MKHKRRMLRDRDLHHRLKRSGHAMEMDSIYDGKSANRPLMIGLGTAEHPLAHEKTNPKKRCADSLPRAPHIHRFERQSRAISLSCCFANVNYSISGSLWRCVQGNLWRKKK
jgi:hypothetical protein